MIFGLTYFCMLPTSFAEALLTISPLSDPNIQIDRQHPTPFFIQFLVCNQSNRAMSGISMMPLQGITTYPSSINLNAQSCASMMLQIIPHRLDMSELAKNRLTGLPKFGANPFRTYSLPKDLSLNIIETVNTVSDSMLLPGASSKTSNIVLSSSSVYVPRLGNYEYRDYFIVNNKSSTADINNLVIEPDPHDDFGGTQVTLTDDCPVKLTPQSTCIGQVYSQSTYYSYPAYVQAKASTDNTVEIVVDDREQTLVITTSDVISDLRIPPNGSTQITITASSTGPSVTNVAVVLPYAMNDKVTQTSTSCATLNPGGTCIITLTRKADSASVTMKDFIIRTANSTYYTTALKGKITLSD